MRYPLPIRLLLAVAVSLGLGLFLLVLLYATDLAFKVWAHLDKVPVWFMGAYAIALLGIAAAGSWAVWRILLPGRSKSEAPQSRPDQVYPRTDTEIAVRVEKAQDAGVDVAVVHKELEELRFRRAAGEVYVALLGQVSTGKSSIVRALLPGADATVDPRGGTTREITRYTWRSPGGDKLILSDLPGLNEPDGNLSELAREEALRAHIVIYLVDGDLTRDQYQELQAILTLGKPVIVAFNKMDLYAVEDLEQIRKRLQERVQLARPEDFATRVDVVAVSGMAVREAIRVYPDGREEVVQREIPPRVDNLVASVQRHIDEDRDTLERLRDATVFVLTARKLDTALSAHRQEQAERLITDYTRKAVFGALAAVSPGTDVVIQGYLGVQLVKRLIALYEVPAQHIDVQRFLDLASRHVGKALPLTLAIAGNALKAFPGVGTLTGGIVHAVAYGLIFDSLGRAVARTLESRGTLPTGLTLRTFEETLSENLETRAERFAKLVLGQGKHIGKPSDAS